MRLPFHFVGTDRLARLERAEAALHFERGNAETAVALCARVLLGLYPAVTLEDRAERIAHVKAGLRGQYGAEATPHAPNGS